MTYLIDVLKDKQTLSSRELDTSRCKFIKPASEPVPPRFSPPDTFFCDTLLDEHSPLNTALKDISIPLFSPFTCTAIPIPSAMTLDLTQIFASLFGEIPSGAKPDTALPWESKTTPQFKSVQSRSLEWHRLTEEIIVILIQGNRKTTELSIRLILDAVEKASSCSLFAGADAVSENSNPDTNHSNPTNTTKSGNSIRTSTILNAIKALDHAAFFGSGALTFFDDVSQNIFGDRLYLHDRIEEAAKAYSKGLELNPKNTNLLNSLGVCHSMMNQLSAARKLFEKAIELDHTDFVALYNAGLTCHLMNDIDAGIRYLNLAISRNDTLFEAHLTAGLLLIKSERVADAVPYLERAAQLNPQSVTAHRILGDLYLERGQTKKAVKVFGIAIRLNPDDPAALSSLAHAYATQNSNLGIAEDLARHSLRLQPDNPYFRIRLAQILVKQGRSDSADAEFAKAEEAFDAWQQTICSTPPSSALSKQRGDIIHASELSFTSKSDQSLEVEEVKNSTDSSLIGEINEESEIPTTKKSA